MNSREIEEKVRCLFGMELNREPACITIFSKLSDDLGCTDLGVAELCWAIEGEFQIEISECEADGFLTVKDVTDCVVSVFISIPPR